MMMALALGSSQVLALDLGQVQVKSALGQPLLAEIPVHSASPAELHSLSVQLASSEEFARANIVGGRTSIPLRFSISNAGGRVVIRITSTAPVDDPYLDLLLQVNSSAGNSVREFAILLDPPGAGAQTPVSSPEPRRTSPVSSRTTAVPARASRPATAPPGVTNGKYGPVMRGQTLSSIAHSTVPTGVDVQQMMLALKQANPDAFYRDNINALKSGQVLRVPSAAEAQAMSIAAAVAEVRRQNSAWRAGTPGKPTVVANAATRDTGASESTASPSSNSDRLSLVPAKDLKSGGGQGSASGAGKNDSALRQDLLRTQEGLASAQQQSADLKTRLKDLTDINSKNEHLLSLKDNQIAELQAKLAAAGKASGQAVAPAAAASAVKPAAETGAMASATLPAATAISPAGTVAAPVVPAVAGSAASVQAAPAAATSAMPAGSDAAVTPAMAVPASTVAAAPAPAPVVESAKPVVAPVPAAKPASPPMVVEQPWYMQTWAWAAAGGVVVLLLLLAMLGRRKSAPTAKAGSSLADRFGAPSGEPGFIGADDVDQEELLDQLAEHPDDLGLHLELVTLYYSRRDVEHFEAAAEAMHAHISDPGQDEWQDVLHMGEDLAPGHPLFDHHVEPLHAEGDARQAFDIDDYAGRDEAPTVVSTMPPLPATPRKVSEYSFNFDLSGAPGDHPKAPGPVPSAADDATVLAPLAEHPHAPDSAPVEADTSWQFDDLEPVGASHASGEFNDDPVDTKLDLARAYVDMGDADGARAMLGEVMKEGSQIQKDTAKRLLDGLH
jgi:pilus assembly protein FimV